MHDNKKNSGETRQLNYYFQRNIQYEHEVGNLFLLASEGKITIPELRQQVMDIEHKIDEIYTEHDFLLKNAFRFIDELHDSFAVEELKKYNGTLEDYASILLGKESKIYTFAPRKGIIVTVNYLKL